MKKVTTRSLTSLARRLVGAADMVDLAATHSLSSLSLSHADGAAVQWSAWLLQGRKDIPNAVATCPEAAGYWVAVAPTAPCHQTLGTETAELKAILEALRKAARRSK